MTEGTPPEAGRRAAVAVLTWRGEETTRGCLESLRVLPGWPEVILVVDNASDTGEGERLAAAFGVAHVTTDHNGGVASGYNAALAWALARGHAHVLLLNNDVRIREPSILDRLLEAAGPRVAAVGPVVHDEGGAVWSAGGRLGRWTGRSWHRLEVAGDRAYPVPYIDGSAMLVSLDAVCEIGGFAVDFFLYWEETDWCARAREAGWEIRLQPTAEVVHARGSTATAHQTLSWSIRNMLLYARRHASVAELLTTIGWWSAGSVPLFAVRVARRRGIRAAAAAVAQVLSWHLRDAARRGLRVHAGGPEIDPGPRP